MAQNAQTGETVVRIVDLKMLLCEEYSQDEVCQLEIQTCSVKFG